jgi:hypothetical protein
MIVISHVESAPMRERRARQSALSVFVTDWRRRAGDHPTASVTDPATVTAMMRLGGSRQKRVRRRTIAADEGRRRRQA